MCIERHRRVTATYSTSYSPDDAKDAPTPRQPNDERDHIESVWLGRQDTETRWTQSEEQSNWKTCKDQHGQTQLQEGNESAHQCAPRVMVKVVSGTSLGPLIETLQLVPFAQREMPDVPLRDDMTPSHRSEIVSVLAPLHELTTLRAGDAENKYVADT